MTPVYNISPKGWRIPLLLVQLTVDRYARFASPKGLSSR
jgi:hypothetical protein